MVKRYIRLFVLFSLFSFRIAFATRLGWVLFFIGKLLRFGLLVFFIFGVVGRAGNIGQFTSQELFIFFLSFQLIDTISQLLFREVYRFRSLVVSGDFDFILLRPVSALFRVLLGGIDPLDMLMLIPVTGLLYIHVSALPSIGLVQICIYVCLLVSAILWAAAFHIGVLSLAIRTTEIDHAMMIYRDVTSMGRIPVDVYTPWLRVLLYTVLPIAFMFTAPVHALLGTVSWTLGLVGGLGSIVAVFMSWKLWQQSIRFYTSASS